MTQHQWDTIEKALASFSVQDKMELIECLRQSIRKETGTPDRPRQQGDALGDSFVQAGSWTPCPPPNSATA